MLNADVGDRSRSFVRRLTDYRWLFLAIAAVAAFVLGCVGFAQFAGTLGPTDVAYSSLKLFFLTAPEKPQLPVPLDIARFLAPLVGGFAAVRGLAVLFRDRAQQMRIPMMRNHYVVCGLGYVGKLFVQQLRDANAQVVVIESNPANPLIEAVRSMHVPVIVGDAQIDRTLRAAGIHRAAHLLAVSDKDAVNTEITVQAQRMVARRQRGELQCLAQLGDPDLSTLLRIQEVNLPGDSSSLDFFNTDDIGARLLLDDFGVDPHRGDSHILVSRLEAFGMALVQHAIRDWHRAHTGNRLWISVLDHDAGDRLDELRQHNPALDNVCTLESAPRMRIHELLKTATTRGAPALSRAYISAYRDEDSLETALSLRHERVLRSVPMVLVLSRAEGVARVIDETRGSGPLDKVDVFRKLERTCTLELVKTGSYRKIAQVLHEGWSEFRLSVGKPAPSWADLDDDHRNVSLDMARSMAVLLRSIGCRIAPLRNWDASDFAFGDDEVETLARVQHDRWMSERRRRGWCAGPYDEAKKLTPYLMPFDRLPEHVAEQNRIAVRGFPAALALAGLGIVRVGRPAAQH
ncbi:MAG: hypothetical protein QOH57_2476 [Mycobacterium sp.]|nr:hypothetical protein [Mycobacterium sp.]